MPLKMAWAITTHMSQGLSLDSVIVHPPSENFNSYGAFYVALSRVRMLKGLRIAIGKYGDSKRIISDKIKTDPEIVWFYNKMNNYYNDSSRTNMPFPMSELDSEYSGLSAVSLMLRASGKY